jgi:hypothetical protein
MRHSLALAALLLAAPACAQFGALEALADVRAGAAALAASKKATAPAKAEDKQAADVRRLADRLIKDGTEAEHAAGVLHAFEKVETKSMSRREVIVGVVELEPKEDEGELGEPGSGYRDLVDRHTYSHLEAQVLDVSVAADGAVSVVSRIYVVSLDGRLMGAISQTAAGKAAKDGTIDLDPSKAKTDKVAPAAAKPDWDKLLPELLKMGRVLEV